MDNCKIYQLPGMQCREYARVDVQIKNEILAVCEYHADKLRRRGARFISAHDHNDARREPMDNPSA